MARVEYGEIQQELCAFFLWLQDWLQDYMFLVNCGDSGLDYNDLIIS